MQEYWRLMKAGKIKVPKVFPFWGEFKRQHQQVKITRTGTLPGYYRYDPPNSRSHIDLLDCIAFSAIRLSDAFDCSDKKRYFRPVFVAR